MTRIDEDGLTETEQLIAELLWDNYRDANGNPIVTIKEDPRTVAQLIRPFLAMAWDQGYVGVINPYRHD